MIKNNLQSRPKDPEDVSLDEEKGEIEDFN